MRKILPLALVALILSVSATSAQSDINHLVIRYSPNLRNLRSYGVAFAGEVEPPLLSGSVAISYSPNLRNLRLVEGQENVFMITVINYMPQPVTVMVSDNCDNRRVTVSHPSTAEVPAGTPDDGGRYQIEVRVRARSAGKFNFEINIDCLAGVPENLENVSGATVLRSYGVAFAGEVEPVGLSIYVIAAIMVAIVLALLAILVVVLKMRGIL
jgi:hypothetical protein